MKLIQAQVEQSAEGQRLDKFLGTLPEIGSRSRAEQLIDKGLVTHAGTKLKGSHRIKSGETYTIQIPAPEPTELQPLTSIQLEIKYEDQDCLVILKPAGLVVHPAAGHAQDTLVNALIGQVNNLAMGFGENRPGIVHRLDKDTSGLLVIAKTDRAQEMLARQFQKRTVTRHYWALVHGTPKLKKKTIESNLSRHPTQRKRFASAEVGKRAVTHYEVIKSAQNLSLLKCKLETGRTHQIRVHLSELGHPVVGDKLYGSQRQQAKLGKELKEQIENLNRIGLHAFELGFNLPSTNQFKDFQADWPADIKPLIEKLGMLDVSTAQT